MLSLVAPYTAEEMWERLGHRPTVARAGWPVVDEALLVEDSVTAVVQVRGKVRARLDVPPTITDAELEAAAMADPAVVRAIDGAVYAGSSSARRSWSTSSSAEPRRTSRMPGRTVVVTDSTASLPPEVAPSAASSSYRCRS